MKYVKNIQTVNRMYNSYLNHSVHKECRARWYMAYDGGENNPSRNYPRCLRLRVQQLQGVVLLRPLRVPAQLYPGSHTKRCFLTSTATSVSSTPCPNWVSLYVGVRKATNGHNHRLQEELVLERKGHTKDPGFVLSALLMGCYRSMNSTSAGSVGNFSAMYDGDNSRFFG